ncbi:ATP-binding cassette domain-containing protein [Paenibacillus aurantius]|uniref:ATP-binding cassette domain-containing protein n=1 Tax=Paenibacillus aurantius TaxID=2918900 RepID=A0AA96LBH3_9BACL|nr:ATP-binding cassette domain-containing protein [Paenibacillus aurantius]WNQ10626.1 ATP-binding cassette domain-containing protein [Paenibacillus aurantius]
MALIELKNLSKSFQIVKRQEGFWNTVKSLVSREYDTKQALKEINLSIREGELVGYIGPNGAGKSTTIKLLAGILTPTSGSVQVAGRVPYRQRKENARDIGVVFGQRSQLYWDLPMRDTFDLYRKMYKIDDAVFRRNVDFYIELLAMQEFLDRPVRQLSLGQKMRADLAVALLHDPKIVYLDEPTIGLDVIAKSRIRSFIREVNKEKGTTVILTTHDMDDIEQICNRIVLINQGSILYDGALTEFKHTFSPGHLLSVELAGDQPLVLADERLVLLHEEGPRKQILFREDRIPAGEAVTLLTRHNTVVDLQLKEPNIEDIIKEIYK